MGAAGMTCIARRPDTNGTPWGCWCGRACGGAWGVEFGLPEQLRGSGHEGMPVRGKGSWQQALRPCSANLSWKSAPSRPVCLSCGWFAVDVHLVANEAHRVGGSERKLTWADRPLGSISSRCRWSTRSFQSPGAKSNCAR